LATALRNQTAGAMSSEHIQQAIGLAAGHAHQGSRILDGQPPISDVNQ
jgi:hypothetical protein